MDASGVRGRQGSQGFAAGVFAAFAGLGAEAAVAMRPCVGEALRTAGGGYQRAGLDLGPDEPQTRVKLAGEDPRGRIADVGAIEVQPDALPELARIGGAEARVRTSRARALTFGASLDTGLDHLGIWGNSVGTRRKDAFEMLHGAPSFHVTRVTKQAAYRQRRRQRVGRAEDVTGSNTESPAPPSNETRASAGPRTLLGSEGSGRRARPAAGDRSAAARRDAALGSRPPVAGRRRVPRFSRVLEGCASFCPRAISRESRRCILPIASRLDRG